MNLFKLLTMPLVELLFFKKASQEVIKYFLSKLVEFILLKVFPFSLFISVLWIVVQVHKDKGEDDIGKEL